MGPGVLLPEQRALAANLPPAARKVLAGEECKATWAPGPGRGLWVLSMSEGAMGYAEWAELMAGLERAMTGAAKRPAPTFAILEQRDAPGLRTPRADYDLIAVYLADLQSLEPVAEAVAAIRPRGEEGLPVNREVAKQFRKVGEQTARAEQAMTYVTGLIALLAGAVAFAILRLRAEQQVAETGMLQAMGMSRFALGAVAATQGFYVWVMGAALGTALGMWGVGVAARLLPDSDPALGAYREWWLVGVVLAAALVVCVVSAWWAGLAARRLSPSEALGTAV